FPGTFAIAQPIPTGDLGPDTCIEGFVWREACGKSDHVCVTPNIRSAAQSDNAAAADRRSGSGAFGPDTCKQGFVLREACGARDRVCVAPTTRSQIAYDNAHHMERLKYPVCRSYAIEAVQMQKQNIEQHCGLEGPRWDENVQAQFAWCLGSLKATIDAERESRQEKIHQ